MTFTDRASLLTSRHIPVVPVLPGEKRTTIQNWPVLATTAPTWTGDYNTAAVCRPDGICVLDVDSNELKLPQTPNTFTVHSASGKPHYYFKQNAHSIALGNRKAAGLFDFQQNRKYVVGPGSVLADGRTYEVVNHAEIAEFPQWLADFIETQSRPERASSANGHGRGVADDFDFAEFAAHYDLDGEQSGSWYRLSSCPVSEHSTNGTTTSVYYDGARLGFKCFDTDCPGHDMSIGAVLKHLHANGHKRYNGSIFADSNWEPADLPITGGTIGGRIRMFWTPEAFEAAKERHANSWESLFDTRAEIESAKPLVFMIDRFMHDRSITVLGGPPAAMKTYTSLAITKALLTGEPLFGEFEVIEQPKRVLYLVPEATRTSIKKRLETIRLMPFVGRSLFVRTLDKGEAMDLNDPRLLKAVDGAVVFLDTATRFMEGDENSSSDQKPFTNALFALQRAGASGVVALHHAPKGTAKAKTLTLDNVLRGTGDLGGMASTVWGLVKVDETNAHVYFQNVKDRDFDEASPTFVIAARYEGSSYLSQTGTFAMHAQPGEAKSLASYRTTESNKSRSIPKRAEMETVHTMRSRDVPATWAEIAKEAGGTTPEAIRRRYSRWLTDKPPDTGKRE